jgi:hypothetical protein
MMPRSARIPDLGGVTPALRNPDVTGLQAGFLAAMRVRPLYSRALSGKDFPIAI